VFAVVTVFTAGVQSIQMWWNKVEPNPTNAFLSKLACFLAAVMLALSAVIVVDSLRRWRELLAGPRPAPVAEPVPEPEVQI
jgi:hypothetical protein